MDSRQGREAVGCFLPSVKRKLFSVITRMDWAKPVKGLNNYLLLPQLYHNFRFNIATRTMYRWLKELGGGNETEMKTGGGDLWNSGGGELSQSDEDPLTLVRRRRKYSDSFKASVLAAYTSVGPVQAARQFGVAEVRSVVESLNSKLLQGLVMQWRSKAGVKKFTEGLTRGSKKRNGVTMKSGGEGEERQTDLTKFANADDQPEMKPGPLLGVKKPFYSAELRSRVLSHYR